MKKIFYFFLLTSYITFSQTDFWSPFNLNYGIRQLIQGPDGVLYAVSDSTILKSTDFGDNWNRIYLSPIFPINSNSFRLEVNANSYATYTIIVRRTSWQASHPVQISVDGGTNWQNLSFPG
ncbi:MAG: hypothetical protein Q8M94_00195, partial [Ignavibacteria bacterium]|nr:hypothetical protein [Ignavibacteria bacterium]